VITAVFADSQLASFVTLCVVELESDNFRNWLGWASGPRNAIKIDAAE
jgi:hypothetical protein